MTIGAFLHKDLTSFEGSIKSFPKYPFLVASGHAKHAQKGTCVWILGQISTHFSSLFLLSLVSEAD